MMAHTLHRPALTLGLALAATACAAPTGPPTPAAGPGPATVVSFSYGTYKDWGTVVADAACDGHPVRFEGSGYVGSRHVAIWLQGAMQSFFPGQLAQGRPPGAVLVGEADVVDGKVTFERTFGPSIGPTSDGGTMSLSPGSRYGWLVVSTDAATGEVPPGADFLAVTIPERPCLTVGAPARLTVAPATFCAGTPVTIAGDGFKPGEVVLQLWKPYKPASGEFNTGKGPPQEFTFGQATANANGHFSYAWTAQVDRGGSYILRALDAGRTRLTSLELTPCP
ncbi:MAG: hypothetical protein JWM80_6332 [Cyanobacteria bacterium RYN_339]|nr:hypothetical protein [Cyanobacteria bacterium RYN_339]